jgi:glyoxylase-like metal-dependent hydrolase (beta-lactamase superfamily II)
MNYLIVYRATVVADEGMSMRHAAKFAVVFCASLLVCACEGDVGPTGPPGSIDPMLSPADKVIVSFGGKELLSELTAISASVSGTRSFIDVGYRPEDHAVPAGQFEATVQWQSSTDHIRLDYQRDVTFAFPQRYIYSELLRSDGGWRIGVDNNRGTPGGRMSSERWGASRRQQHFLHPEFLVRDLAMGRRAGRDLGIGVLGGVLHHRLEVPDSVSPLILWIEVGTGRLAKISTIENEHLRTDVALETYYSNWTALGNGLTLPQRVAISIDGEVVHEELRAIVANPDIAADTFTIPDGGTTMLVEEEVKRGERSHQFYEMYSTIGSPRDGDQVRVLPRELRPGVWHIEGSTHNSLIVEQAAGIVVVEAPLYARRSEALLAWIGEQFPGKPVTHVVVTHFHSDHSAGLRTFVGAGATVIAGAAALALYRRVFSAPRTIEPDRQAMMPRQAVLRGVSPGAVVTLPSGSQSVHVYTVDTTHSADMVVAVVDGVLFVSDIYNPGVSGRLAELRELRQAISENPDIPVATIAGSHGTTSTLQELDDLIGRSTIHPSWP